MQIEKFSSGEKTGYKIIGATFASSKNVNGAYFDPIEVFAGESNNSFNFGHKDYSTDYSSGTEITKKPEAKIDGKLLRFTWDLETTNENFIKLIEAENFGGFSPELKPKNKPITHGKERFYRSGDLEWVKTAILGKDQKPGFVGANEYALEKFEAFEDIVIEKIEEPALKEIIKENFDATILEARIEKLETELNQIKENFSQKEAKKEDFSNDELIDQKAKLEAEIAKLTADKTKTEIFNSSLIASKSEKLTKGDPVGKITTDEVKKNKTISEIIPN